MDFKGPPIYEFPPFFTRQINEDTWQAQKAQWQGVISTYCTETGQYQISNTSSLFTNPRIHRTLRPDVAAEILSDMVVTGRAEKVGAAKDTGLFYIFARRPVELAAELKQWAVATGHSGSVVTLYELTEAETPGLDLFRGMDLHLLRRVAEALAKNGDAAALKESGEIVGLKFSSP